MSDSGRERERERERSAVLKRSELLLRVHHLARVVQACPPSSSTSTVREVGGRGGGRKM